MLVDEKSIGPDSKRRLTQGWNEVGFVPWQSFHRMAPSILNLEVGRLGDLISEAGDMDVRNALVKSRYELQSFIDLLRSPETAAGAVEMSHLQAAILNLPMGYPNVSAEHSKTLAYILDRLEYVHNRIRFVYR